MTTGDVGVRCVRPRKDRGVPTTGGEYNDMTGGPTAHESLNDPVRVAQMRASLAKRQLVDQLCNPGDGAGSILRLPLSALR